MHPDKVVAIIVFRVISTHISILLELELGVQQQNNKNNNKARKKNLFKSSLNRQREHSQSLKWIFLAPNEKLKEEINTVDSPKELECSNLYEGFISFEFMKYDLFSTGKFE